MPKSSLAGDTEKLKLAEFLSEIFYVSVVEKHPKIKKQGCLARLRSALCHDQEFGHLTVGEFLKKANVQELRKFPNLGSTSLSWLAEYLNVFDLYLPGLQMKVVVDPSKLSDAARKVLKRLR